MRPSTRRLLVLNRRDPLNPLGGGAEVYLHEAARAFLEAGWGVDWFASSWPGAPPHAQHDGVRILRRGGEMSCHAHAQRLLRDRSRRYDIILDSFNGIGFGTARNPASRLMIFQLYGREFWCAEKGKKGLLFAQLERFLLRAYRRRAAITISDSTRRDLEMLGFHEVAVVPVGLARAPLAAVPARAEAPLRLVYAGRLRRTKNVEDALRAFQEIRATLPDAEIEIVGRGPQEDELKARYGGGGVRFLGFVDEEEKYRRLAAAHLALVPSIREGWNMVVTEAAAVGTPCIGYRVPGIVDSVRDGETGLLVEPRDVRQMAAAAIVLYRDRERYRRFCENALAWAGTFTWERTRRAFYRAVTGETP